MRQLGKVNGAELAVVGDGKTTAQGGQGGQRELRHVTVAVEVKIGARRQVRSREVGDEVAEKTERTSQVGERGNRDGAAVAEGHVLGGDQVGEVDVQLVAVVRNCQGTRNVLHVVDVDLVQVVVGSQFELTNRVELNSLQGSQTGVDDGDRAGGVDTLGETQTLDVGESLEVDGADGDQLGEVERGQSVDAGQLELTANLADGWGRDGGDVDGTGSGEVTSNLLDSIECQGGLDLAADSDVSGVGRAAAKGIGIGLSGDLSTTGAAVVCSDSGSQ